MALRSALAARVCQQLPLARGCASVSAPDPMRTKYLETLDELMQLVVFHGRTQEAAFADVHLDTADGAALRLIVNT